MKTLMLLSAAGMIAAAPALAHGHDETGDALQIYAAMAKLEANMAEAAGAVMAGAMAGTDGDIRTEALEDFNSDVSQIESYVTSLRAASLNDAQTQALDMFESEWTPIAKAGEELLKSDEADIQQAAFAWWESLDGLDDLIDDQLEAILKDQGIEPST